jgi:hypothetical protein
MMGPPGAQPLCCALGRQTGRPSSRGGPDSNNNHFNNSGNDDEHE